MTSNDMLVRTIRVRNRHEPGVFGRLATAIGDQDGMLGTITTVALTSQYTVRDLDVLVDDEAHLQRVLDAIAALPDSQVLEVRDEVLAAHRGGKIRMVSRQPIGSLAELRKVYTPGVAEVCLLLHDQPDLAYLYTRLGQAGAGRRCPTRRRPNAARPAGAADARPAALRRHEDRGNRPATLEEVLTCCDVVVATTGVKGLIAPEQVRTGQIILALSNPEP